MIYYCASFPNFEPDHSQVHIALFRNVSNATDLKNRIVSAATAQGDSGERERQALNFAFINARLITSRTHLETAIYQAILADESQEGLRTKTVHSEILYYLNPTHNITEAIRRYGVSATTTDLFVVRVGSPQLAQVTVEESMRQVVMGNLVSLSELENITDWSTIKKYHRLNNELAIKNAQDNPTKEHRVIDNIVISSVAMKSVMQ